MAAVALVKNGQKRARVDEDVQRSLRDFGESSLERSREVSA
jgi:hypothetical protein